MKFRRLIIIVSAAVAGWVSAGFPAETLLGPLIGDGASAIRQQPNGTISYLGSDWASIIPQQFSGISDPSERVSLAIALIQKTYRQSPQTLITILSQIPKSEWCATMQKASSEGDRPFLPKIFFENVATDQLDLSQFKPTLTELAFQDPISYAAVMHKLSNHPDLAVALKVGIFASPNQRDESGALEQNLVLAGDRLDALNSSLLVDRMPNVSTEAAKKAFYKLQGSAASNPKVNAICEAAALKVLSADPNFANEILALPENAAFITPIIKTQLISGDVATILQSPLWDKLSTDAKHDCFLYALGNSNLPKAARTLLITAALNTSTSIASSIQMVDTTLNGSLDPAETWQAVAATGHEDVLLTEIIKKWAVVDVVGASRQLANNLEKGVPDETLSAFIKEIHDDSEAKIAWSLMIKDEVTRTKIQVETIAQIGKLDPESAKRLSINLHLETQ